MTGRRPWTICDPETEWSEAHAFYLSRGYEAVKTQLALTKSVAPTG